MMLKPPGLVSESISEYPFPLNDMFKVSGKKLELATFSTWTHPLPSKKGPLESLKLMCFPWILVIRTLSMHVEIAVEGLDT